MKIEFTSPVSGAFAPSSGTLVTELVSVGETGLIPTPASSSAHRAESEPRRALEQIQEKWTPVFRPDLCQNECLERLHDSKNRENAIGEGAAKAPAFAIFAEQPADVPARDVLLDRAMGPRWRRKSSEKLRRGRKPSLGLALVARDMSGKVVGTVRLWDVAAGEGGPAGLLLGPLAVDPALKSAGIGSALMQVAIAEAKRFGHKAILLVGDAPYYGRFGFSAEKTGKLAMPGPYERHRFLALELVDGALDGAAGVLKATWRLEPKRLTALASAMASGAAAGG
jgi:predicted N-acetyltransferase YhbS